MSSMRNAVQRRNHKERAQPLEREKWGILEKHKDYSKRARDYNEKKARLRILRQKAAEKNPDEFYFGMMSGKTHDKGRKLADRGNKTLSHAAVKLMKTQDAGYLRTMLQQTRKELERVEQEVVLGPEQSTSSAIPLTLMAGVVIKGQKIRYVDSADRQLAVVSDENAPQDTIEDMEEHESRELPAIGKKKKKVSDARMSRLLLLRERETALAEAEKELELQRAKMGNNMGGVNKNGVKWRVKQRKN